MLQCQLIFKEEICANIRNPHCHRRKCQLRTLLKDHVFYCQPVGSPQTSVEFSALPSLHTAGLSDHDLASH